MPRKEKKSKENRKVSNQGVAVSGFLGSLPKKKKTNKGKKYKKPLSFPELNLDDIVRKVLNTPPPKDDVSE